MQSGHDKYGINHDSNTMKTIRRFTKMDKKANKTIECSVKQCANHCKSQEFCALEKVRIGTHEANPTMNQCVDCESFILSSSDSVK